MAAAGAATGDGLYTWETILNLALGKGVGFRYYYSDLPFGSVYGRDTVENSAPISQFYSEAAAGTLPQICFVDPPFRDGGGGDGLSADEHPHGDIRLGQAFMSDVAHAFMESPQYRRGALFIDYDEWGGFFDHVKPRFVPDDRRSKDLDEDFGMTGFRIPGVAISPFTKGGGVNHMTVTHESILKLISYRFGLGYLNKRHRYASNIGAQLRLHEEGLRAGPPTRPAEVASTPCSLQRSEDPGAEAPHGEMDDLVTSGYLDRIGAKVYEGTADEIFRKPDSVRRALEASNSAAMIRRPADHSDRLRRGELADEEAADAPRGERARGGAAPPRLPRPHRGARRRRDPGLRRCRWTALVSPPRRPRPSASRSPPRRTCRSTRSSS